MMGPLRITLDMAAPIVSTGHMIHLDAMLAWIRTKHAPQTGPKPVAWEPDECVSLPLAVMRDGDDWWYRASAVRLEDGATSRAAWSKKWDKDHEDLLDLGRASQLTLKLGRNKEARVPIELIYVPRLVFYAVGEYRRVKKLINRVTHVGAKASQGYGLIASMTIDKLDMDPDFDLDWKTIDDRPARNLPIGFAERRGLVIDRVVTAPLRPPYWRLLDAHVCEVAS